MKKNIFYTLLLVAGLCSFSACNDSGFLTEKPKTIYTTENSYETVDQVKASVTNLYVHIRYWYSQNKFLKGLGSDVMDTPYFRCSGNGYCNFSSWSSSSCSSNDVYNAMFQLVNYANQTMEGWNKEGLSWENENEKNEVLGEILFFRGYGYLTLGELFGGVPIVDQFYQTLKLDFTRASREETYKFAIKDLETAAVSLPDYPSEAGRVAKGTAYHFLSEAYVALATIKNNNSDDLRKAVEYADKVIAMHPLMIERFGSRATQGATKNGIEAYYPEGNVFFYLFQEGNYDYCEGNTEALWTLQHDYDVSHQYGGNNAINFPREFSPVYRDVPWKPEYKEDGASSGPWNDNIDLNEYPGGNVCAYLGGRGIGSISPTTYVIEDVWDGDLWNDMRNAPCNIRREFVCMDTKHSMYGKVVPKSMLDHTILMKISEYYPIWTKLTPIDDWGYDDLESGGNRTNIFWDQYACRSAETVLLKAEAYLRMGDKEAAADAVNILRKRAKCEKLCTADVINLQYILNERVRELYGEERRWVTLLRLGQDGINSINEHAMYIVSQPYFGDMSVGKPKISRWTLFPIPQTVIDTNTGAVIEQNEGWY